MNIINQLKSDNCPRDKLIEYLDSLSPIVLYEVMSYIVRNHVFDESIIEKLMKLTQYLNEEHKMVGYYKIGHVAMATLLKLGVEKRKVFSTSLDSFNKNIVYNFISNNDW